MPTFLNPSPCDPASLALFIFLNTIQAPTPPAASTTTPAITEPAITPAWSDFFFVGADVTVTLAVTGGRVSEVAGEGSSRTVSPEDGSMKRPLPLSQQFEATVPLPQQ